MVKMYKTILFSIVLIVAISGCKKEGCTNSLAKNYDSEAVEDDGSCEDQTNLSLIFTHNFDGKSTGSSSYDLEKHVTENQDTVQIYQLKYLISDIVLYTEDGTSVPVKDYCLVDIFEVETHIIPGVFVKKANYTSIGFTIGFNEHNNSQYYSDLDDASWHWPPSVGGGWYIMEFYGYYKRSIQWESFKYYYGNTESNGETEPNHREVKLSAVSLTGDLSSIEIKMDIAEWFKNPSAWDFEHNGNDIWEHPAQKAIQAQAKSVFSIGTVQNQD
jgi:hypothetical protein